MINATVPATDKQSGAYISTVITITKRDLEYLAMRFFLSNEGYDSKDVNFGEIELEETN